MVTSQKLLYTVRFIYLTFAVIVTMIQFQTVSIYLIYETCTYVQGMAPPVPSYDPC